MNSIDKRLAKLQLKVNQINPPKYKRPSHQKVVLMLDDQVGRCAICEDLLSNNQKLVHVDHCHNRNLRKSDTVFKRRNKI